MTEAMTPSERIDIMIAQIPDWRSDFFTQLRQAILSADPQITEDWKWMGSPVWYRDGMIAVANAHKGKVKLTFANGAQLADPKKLFNNGLEGNARRSIDFLEGDKLDKPGLQALVQAAIKDNQARLAARAAKPRR